MEEKLSFEGQVVVVTGAGHGVGRAYALEFARRGAKVVVNDLGGATDGTGAAETVAAQVTAEIVAQGGEAVASVETVATETGGQSIVDTAVEHFGRLDAVVCNAGILRDRSAAKLTIDELRPVLDVHLMGSFFVALPAYRHMKEQGYGRLVLTTSASGLFGNFGQANYAAAKMGVVGLGRVLAIEGAKYGITANVIAPAASTRLTRGEEGGDDDPKAPWRVAPIVVALCHESNAVTGEIFLAGGGVFARSWVALGDGWAAHAEDELTAENLVDHWDDIRSTDAFTLPDDAMATGPWMKERMA